MQSRKIGKEFDFEELFGKKELHNLERIRLAANDVWYDYYDNEIANKDIIKDSEYAKKIVQKFIESFYGGKFILQYKNFLKRSEQTQSDDIDFDDADGFVKGNLYNRRIYRVGLPSTNTFSGISVFSHEFAHFLHFKNASKMTDDFLYIEIPSILMQSLFVDYCVKHDYFKECNDLEYIYIFDCVSRYLYNPSYSFLDYENCKQELLAFYENINEFYDDCLYYFGYCYANRLRELYLEDPKKMEKRILGLFNGAKLEDMLKYYNVNMQDENTIEATLKLIKRIK